MTMSALATIDPMLLTTRDALMHATARLQAAGVEQAALDARLLLLHLLDISAEMLLRGDVTELAPEQENRYFSLINRRVGREPLAYIIGVKSFWSLDFTVTADTLIPRPDSETLVEAVLKYVEQRSKPLQFLDFGTGSGCLLLSLLTEFPRSRGLGIDTCHRALHVAMHNAQRLKLHERASWQVSNWGASVDASLKGTFDVIVSNPPYIEQSALAALQPEVARFEPRAALTDEGDGLGAYRALADDAPALLAPGGRLFLEIGQGQERDVARIMAEQNLFVHAFERDLAGIIRCLVLGHAPRPLTHQTITH